MKVHDVPGFLRPSPTEHMFVDVGAYGIPRKAWKGTFDARASGESRCPATWAMPGAYPPVHTASVRG